jgi:hypothetical protein
MQRLPLTLLSLLFAHATASSNKPTAAVPPVNWEDYEAVSMVQLIAAPQQFDGRKVRVSGFATVEFEGTALFLTREDMRYLNTKNGLWLDLGSEDRRTMDRRYVRVYGVFTAGMKGHRDAYSGTIQSVARMDRLRVMPRGFP